MCGRNKQAFSPVTLWENPIILNKYGQQFNALMAEGLWGAYMQHREAAQFTGSNMPQRCESNTPSASSQNTYSRQLKHPGHIRIAILNPVRGSVYRALRCGRPAFPLFIPCAYLFASGRLCSKHFPAAFHLPWELRLKHVNQSGFKRPTLSPHPRWWHHKHAPHLPNSCPT